LNTTLVGCMLTLCGLRAPFHLAFAFRANSVNPQFVINDFVIPITEGHILGAELSDKVVERAAVRLVSHTPVCAIYKGCLYLFQHASYYSQPNGAPILCCNVPAEYRRTKRVLDGNDLLIFRCRCRSQPQHSESEGGTLVIEKLPDNGPHRYFMGGGNHRTMITLM
jgi:hypothetical protein